MNCVFCHRLLTRCQIPPAIINCTAPRLSCSGAVFDEGRDLKLGNSRIVSYTCLNGSTRRTLRTELILVGRVHLDRHRDPVQLQQLLRQQGRAEVRLLLLQQTTDPGPECLTHAPVRRPAALVRNETCVAVTAPRTHQTFELPHTDPKTFRRFALAQTGIVTLSSVRQPGSIFGHNVLITQRAGRMSPAARSRRPQSAVCGMNLRLSDVGVGGSGHG